MNHRLINQDSGNTEYYTDKRIIDAAREVMGSIDLDPASSEAANKIVMATEYYTIEDDGLSQNWQGNVWLNHPFGRGRNASWINKLIQHYTNGDVPEFCCITFAATSERWFQPLFNKGLIQCFLCPRTNYYSADGNVKKGVTKGSVVTYGGRSTALFKEIFQWLGAVKGSV